MGVARRGGRSPQGFFDMRRCCEGAIMTRRRRVFADYGCVLHKQRRPEWIGPEGSTQAVRGV